MIDLLDMALLFAADPGPRGDNPEGGAGVLLIAGIALAVLLLGFLLLFAFRRFGGARQRAMERNPAPEGRVGRVSEFQDR